MPPVPTSEGGGGWLDPSPSTSHPSPLSVLRSGGEDGATAWCGGGWPERQRQAPVGGAPNGGGGAHGGRLTRAAPGAWRERIWRRRLGRWWLGQRWRLCQQPQQQSACGHPRTRPQLARRPGRPLPPGGGEEKSGRTRPCVPCRRGRALVLGFVA
ncbi:hypothetical protein QYE76_039527 [Lolium multiflorum]|uniref:Uncharacterized protein n=1 Tax=Lolium multiflorum TaxID=4521 RepID=A0AAD8WS92_LOLMU|nr:hypothetical protein QYE76_039527 [Lolium multiflorum]